MTAPQPDDMVAGMISAAMADNANPVGAALRWGADRVGAMGAVVWCRVKTHGKNRLYARATALPPGATELAHGAIDWQHSISGEIIERGGCAHVADVAKDGRLWDRQPVFSRLGVRSLSVAATGSEGALNLYFDRVAPTPDTRVVAMASAIPLVLEVARDRLSLALFKAVDGTLRELDERFAGGLDDASATPKPLDGLCSVIAQVMGAMEVSAFFARNVDQPDQFDLVGTTWPGQMRQERYCPTTGMRGITGWVLTRGRSVRILDLLHFEDDLPAIEEQYQGLEYANSLSLDTTYRGFHGLPDAAVLPPASLLAVPVKVAGRVVGVIRVCGTREPRHFAEEEEQALAIVGDMTGRAWGQWVRARAAARATVHWLSLAVEVNRHAGTLQRSYRSKRDRSETYGKILKLAEETLSNADCATIRLLDADRSSLVVPPEIQAPPGIPERVSMTGDDLGARCFRDWKPIQVREDEDGFPAWAVGRFKAGLAAPIGPQDDKQGVVEVWSTVAPGFTIVAESAVLPLLGGQVGIGLRQSALLKEQRQTFEDLGHQLKGPLYSALRQLAETRSRMERESPVDRDRTMGDLQRVRATVRKAHRASVAIQLLGQSMRGHQLKLKFQPIDESRLRALLIESATNAQAQYQEQRGVRFEVDDDSLHSALEGGLTFPADPDFVGQCVQNLLDNAGKYGRGGHSADITVFRDGGHVRVTVRNRSGRVRLLPEHVDRVAERGWRSTAAISVVGEGSGIGLYLVALVMKAHGGRLEAKPTDADGFTVFELWFPIKKPGVR